ncbi:MAG: hypothetical protein FJW39_30395 [Acidobacteria bacterium]|nr:hypothetical protein [Acidobacteriota bacterium]
MASGITPLKFTGISSFSEDFQAILNRSAQIAALPVKLLQNQQTNLLSKKQALNSLGSSVDALRSAVRNLGEVASTRALSATSSNISRVAVSLNGATVASSYTITDITSVARRASETTVSGFATSDSTAVDADNNLELYFGGTAYAIDLTAGGNNLESLRDATNGLGTGVTATILNTGSGATPYYLSLTATSPGSTSLELRTTAGSAASNLLTNTNQGADAVFKLNGLAVSKSDNVVSDVIPGLTFTIQDETDPGESVTLNLTSSRGSLATALQSFVTAYNTAAGKVNQQIGENAGLLSGDYIVGQVSRTLRQISGYAGTGAVKSLTELGVEFDKTGVASFNLTKFYSLPTGTIEAGFDFIGSTSTGFGGLHSALDQITNPVNGLIRTQTDTYDVTDRRITVQVEEIVARLETAQLSLSFKLQQADLLISGFQSQQNVLAGAIQSLTLATFGKRDN